MPNHHNEPTIHQPQENGRKFPQAIKTLLQRRTDTMEAYLTNSDEEMTDFTDKNLVEPLFVALAELCLKTDNSIMTIVLPTVALTAFSSRNQRTILGKRFHIDTVLTSHKPGQINLSQNTGINESIVVAKASRRSQTTHKVHQPRPDADRRDRSRRPTQSPFSCDEGTIPDGWGIASYWPSERMEEGDWTPAVWRSP